MSILIWIIIAIVLLILISYFGLWEVIFDILCAFTGSSNDSDNSSGGSGFGGGNSGGGGASDDF